MDESFVCSCYTTPDHNKKKYVKIILQLVQFHLNGSVIKLHVKFSFALPAASVVSWFKGQTRDKLANFGISRYLGYLR